MNIKSFMYKGSKYRFFIVLFSFFIAVQIHTGADEFCVAPLGEVIGLGWDGLAYGGGLILGYGDGAAIGLRFLYTQDTLSFVSMELQAFFRLYFFSLDANNGPFIQASGGPIIYSDTRPEISGYGNISAGLSTGWRFLLGKHFFIEPVIRIGYPYLIGGGVSTGFRTGGSKS